MSAPLCWRSLPLPSVLPLQHVSTGVDKMESTVASLQQGYCAPVVDARSIGGVSIYKTCPRRTNHLQSDLKNRASHCFRSLIYSPSKTEMAHRVLRQPR